MPCRPVAAWWSSSTACSCYFSGLHKLYTYPMVYLLTNSGIRYAIDSSHCAITKGLQDFSLFRSLYSCLCYLGSPVLRHTSRLET